MATRRSGTGTPVRVTHLGGAPDLRWEAPSGSENDEVLGRAPREWRMVGEAMASQGATEEQLTHSLRSADPAIDAKLFRARKLALEGWKAFQMRTGNRSHSSKGKKP